MSIKIEWLDTLTTATEYRVYRSTISGSLGVLVATLPAGTTEYTDTSSLPTDVYYTIAGLVDAVEVQGDQFHVIGSSFWRPTLLTNVTGTDMYEYDVSDTGTLEANGGGSVSDGDLVQEIDRADGFGSAGALGTTTPANMPTYRDDGKQQWLEFGDASFFTDSANPNSGIMNNKFATLFSINCTPLDVSITDNFPTTENVFFAFDRNATDPFFKVQPTGYNTQGGFRLRVSSKRNAVIGDPFLLFIDSISRPSYTPITLWFNWDAGTLKVYKVDEKIIDTTFSIIASNTETGFASLMRLMENASAKFYGMVLASRDTEDFREGEVNSLISHMKRKFHGRS